MRPGGYDDPSMKVSLVSLTLLAAGLGSASAQNQVPGGTPLLVQPPQNQVQPAVTFVLAYPLLAMPETSPAPSRVKLTLSRPADTLEVLGAPKGMTVTITQDTLTVETKGVPVGQYPLRITGRWGNDTKSVELLVSVYALNGTVAPITGPAEPGPSIPTSQATPTTPATRTTTVTPIQISTPTATVTTSGPRPASTTVTSTTVTSTTTPPPATTAPATTAPATTASSVTVPTTSTTEIRPVQAPPTVTPVQAPPVVTVTTPAPAATTTAPPVMQQDIPQAAPATVTPSIPTMTVPYQNPPARTAESGGRFTVWGGMGTERGIVGGLNVGLSSDVARFSAFQVAVRGTAELYPNARSGLGLPVIGADVLLSRQGSRLYYGPSTSLAFGAGNSWAIGGLVGYSSTWNKDLGYYLEGRARYAHLGGQNTLSPGFRVGFTYKLGN